MKSNPVVHFEIYVDDMARAKAFYEALFDIQLAPMPSPSSGQAIEMWCFPMATEAPMHSYGAGGMLVKMAGFSPAGKGTLVYFGCDDCGVLAARAATLGGGLCQEKTAIGEHGFYALVQDTEGNLIGLHSMQ